MHFWRKDYFQTLKDVAAEAGALPEWADYAAFCLEYERGLRPQAFAILERFMHSLERASFDERAGASSRASDSRVFTQTIVAGAFLAKHLDYTY